VSSEDGINGHFVYMYRDQAGNPLYVGKQGSDARSLSHTGDRAHNNGLTNALASLKSYAIEIAGPFETPDIAAVVEAALISALANTPSVQKHLQNKIGGVSSGTFRPLGVPLDLAQRPSLAPITGHELKVLSKGKPVLLVYVGSEKLGDREGVDLAHLPSDFVIQERIVRWWQLDKFMDSWRANPELVPAMLLGVSGTPKHRIVVGSLQINAVAKKLPWMRSEKGRLSEVPVHPHPTLDFANLRGRRLEPGLTTFGGITPLFFNILSRSAEISP